MYVYIIINEITKDFYVGITNGNNRWYFGSGHMLKDNIKKYGKQNFSKRIIDSCYDRHELSEREKYWIKYFKNKWTKRRCLNLTEGGDNEYTLTPESRENIKTKLINYYKYRPDLCKIYSERAKNTLVKWTKENGRGNQVIFEIDKLNIIDEYINYRKNGTELAKEYNVSPSTINKIVSLYLKKKCNGSGNGSAKLKEPDVIKIRELYKTGKYLHREIATMYGVQQSLISRIVNRLIWKHI